MTANVLDLALALLIGITAGYVGGWAAVRGVVGNLRAIDDAEQQREYLERVERRDEQGPPRR